MNKKPKYPPNVENFILKWQPPEDGRRKAFWKEFRKAANAYTLYRLENTDRQINY